MRAATGAARWNDSRRGRLGQPALAFAECGDTRIGSYPCPNSGVLRSGLSPFPRLGPFRVGSHAGDRLWSTRGRYVLRVRYYRSVVDPEVLWEALSAFKQAHVFLWFEDISGVGGSYAQN